MKDDIKIKVKEEAERIMKTILEKGLDSENIEVLGKVVDIHKDLANEEYWKNKEEVMKMRYRGYSEGGYSGRGGYSEGGYSEGRYSARGRGRSRDSQGRFKGGQGSGRYRGEEMMDEMMFHYGNYSEGREQYGAEGDTIKALEYMMEAVVEFIEMLKEEAGSQKEVELIKHYTKKISEM